MERPKIVCLCGSTRFKDKFAEMNFQETLAGRIVLSIGCDAKSDAYLGITPEQKVRLDELHKRKIDLCDEVLVLNVDAYVGESTRSEIAYAVAHGKRVRYLEPYHSRAFLNVPLVDDELRRLLEEARALPLPPMTAAERREQRISFAYGNGAMHNPSITREDVERAHDEIYGKPEEK